jgi:hypothetical protein
MAKILVFKNYKISQIYKIIPEYILMYAPKKDEVTEDRWSLHDEMFHDLHCSEYFVGDKK